MTNDYLKVTLDFLMETLRGTRLLQMKEGRSIANTLRKFYPSIFPATPGIKGQSHKKM